MLQVSHLSKRFGAAAVLDDVSFALGPASHAALVGPNGSGKTTLLRCIAGREEPDSGRITTPRGYLVGYLSQTLDEIRGLTVGSVLGTTPAVSGEPWSSADRPRERHRITSALDLAGLPPEQPASSLSGGQKTRLALGRVLLGNPDALLLDEPTNHLDIDGLGWLEAFLNRFPGPVLIVSHDREFLDRTATSVMALDPETHSVREYHGNYSDFAAVRAREETAEEEAWRRQQEYVAKVRRDIAAKKSGARSIERSTTPRQPGIRRLAKKKAALAKSRERKLDRYLSSPDRVAKPRREWSLNLRLNTPRRSSREAVRLERVTAGYRTGDPILDGVSLSLMHGDRVGVVGPNGSGKTTLLRILDGRLTPSSGRIWRSSNVRIGVLAQEQETLESSLSVLEVVRRSAPMSESDTRTFLHQLLFTGDDAFKLVEDCSPGERARLQLARLVLSGTNVMTLDEPLNHLDIPGRERFEEALSCFSGAVVIVAHDRAFLRTFAERIVEVGGGTVRVFAGGYEEYEDAAGTWGAGG